MITLDHLQRISNFMAPQDCALSCTAAEKRFGFIFFWIFLLLLLFLVGWLGVFCSFRFGFIFVGVFLWIFGFVDFVGFFVVVGVFSGSWFFVFWFFLFLADRRFQLHSKSNI